MTDPDLVAAAVREINSRETHYPGMVASGKKSADDAQADFQAWHVIRAFLETGVFEGIDAGGETGTRRIGWKECCEAADKAVASTQVALNGAQGDVAKRARLDARLTALRAIARKVGRQARLIAGINEEFEARRRAAPTDGGRKAA